MIDDDDGDDDGGSRTLMLNVFVKSAISNWETYPAFSKLTSIFLQKLTEKLELLLTERESLYATWDDRKTEVDQACDLHVFLRDARQVDSLYSSQEVILIRYLSRSAQRLFQGSICELAMPWLRSAQRFSKGSSSFVGLIIHHPMANVDPFSTVP